MTKKDFFILAIKLIGLFSLITSVFSIIPNNIYYALMDVDILSILWIMMSAVVIGGLFVLLVFNADKVVRALKLDKGFDDHRIELGSLTSADIIKIAAFILGGLLFINNIPAFLSHALFAFKGKNMGIEYTTDDTFAWSVCTINLIVGYLLSTNYDFVAKKLNKQPEDETASTR